MILTILATAASLATAPAVTKQPADNNAIRGRHDICALLAAASAFPALDLADCLSFDTAPEPVFRTQVCTFLRESDQLHDYDFSSYDECLRRGPAPVTAAH